MKSPSSLDVPPWIRQGTCGHCGWCCLIVAESEAVVQLSPTSDVAFYRVHGFQLVHQDGMPVQARQRVAHLSRCPQWTGTTGTPGCRVYAERPVTCAAFPQAPAQVTHPDCPCTYWFERTWPDGTVERLGGQGSPYPVSTEVTHGTVATVADQCTARYGAGAT